MELSADFLQAIESLSAEPDFVWLDSDGSDGHRYSYLLAGAISKGRVDFEELPSLKPVKQGNAIAWPRYFIQIDYDAVGIEEPPRLTLPPLQKKKEHKRRVTLVEFDAALVYDHQTETISFAGGDKSIARLKNVAKTSANLDFQVGSLQTTPENEHQGNVESVLQEIRAGNVYQVNIARQWQGEFSGSRIGLALAMRKQSPVPLGLVANFEGNTLIGRSMETYLSWDGKRLRSRPIKGTAARSQNSTNENAELRNDPKEHAEHAMIVDLIRNDLANIAEIGSVDVEHFLELEQYPGLTHLVSTVSATPKSPIGWGKVFAATFPPGSVTGSPKSTALHIIDALEDFERGPYCGSYGAIFSDNSAKFAVAIRSASISADIVKYWAGGGLVAESQAKKEFAETELKSRVFVDAINSNRK